MKFSKLFLAAAVVCTLASCTKDYTCTCSFPDVGGVSTPDVVTPFEGLNGSEADDAQATCESGGCTWE